MSGAIQRDVVVVGGGLAGTAAALALSQGGAEISGNSITVLDRRPTLGGRAYSYPHPALDEVVDSQHVILGCCTNLIDLFEQAGAADTIRWYDQLFFLEPNGNRTRLAPGVLPAPSHQTISFLRAPMLGLSDKIGVARGLVEFLRGYPASDAESFATWLKRTRQTERAIRHFWEPVVVGALNDGFDNCSTKYAGKVFHESFLRSPQAGRLGIPALPLSEWLNPLTELAQSRGVDVRMKTGMTGLEQIAGDRWRVTTESAVFETSNVILAVDFKQTQGILRELPGGAPIAAGFEHFIAAPITTIHLWFDREVIDLDHAVLLDTRIQWIFTKSRIRRWPASRGTYLELVISASWPELKLGREEILASALEELAMFFPAVKTARLVKSSVLKEARATFSVTPGLDAYRPTQKTPWPGLYLAGDWTATEWPSTMEGAVRSGRLAAGALMGDMARYLSAELPATGVMPLLVR
ncbi:zeta-carotene desaturase [Granulicella aggregans]|uniref:Zeta-carotene desaturase n=1 Tax=Granulicella aggregans TaxID=474949 RepID=A0A7W7ZH46_9BACT|nr:hydroxysqualene dehydroxylase HpnE [Granulicella aggregans]MBB5059829.1 zeta-carotene desaturase [Granulicella aggregans]